MLTAASLTESSRPAAARSVQASRAGAGPAPGPGVALPNVLSGLIRSSPASARGAAPPPNPGSPVATAAGAAGTARLSRIIGAAGIQARVAIGKADDPLEREADVMAERAVAAPSPAAVPPAAGLSGAVSRAPAILRMAEAGDEEIQARPLAQREGGGGESTASEDFSVALSASKGGGAPLPDGVRASLEPGMGADFSGVRVHTGPQAARMNREVGAQAFTHGNDVYFNEGAYSPGTGEGRRLIAHELAHTVQQGASVRKRVQRSWLGDAWGAVSAAASFVTDSLEAGLDWIRGQFADFVIAIPGYRALTVVLGRDPVRGEDVPRNGRSFIEAALDIIPFGNLLQAKLNESGAMEQAAAWLDNRMAQVNVNPAAIAAGIRAFWAGLSLSRILTDTRAVLDEAAGIIRRPVEEILSFARDAAAELLRAVKRAVLGAVVGFVRDHTRGYPLLTVILGRDPITEAPVERTGMNLIRGFMLLSEEGGEQIRQMEETGSLQRAADWVDGAVAELGMAWEGLRNAFTTEWERFTILDLMSPVETWNRVAATFGEPVMAILRFVGRVALMILKFIKDALLGRLSAYARAAQGYPLLTVLLGKDPFTGEPVPRGAVSIVRGFMSLMEGGEQRFEEINQTGAIQRFVGWLDGAVAGLGFTWEYITGLFRRAWETLTLGALAAPLQAFQRILALFGPPILRLFEFLFQLIRKIVEILLLIMNFPTNLVVNIVNRAMEAYQDIRRDPIGFFKNLLRAIKQGFSQFFGNILSHLQNGVVDWLFGELADAGITPPPDFSLQSILGLVMQILGITMERIWQKLGDRIGHERVARARAAIDRLTGIWTFVRDVMERGPVAIWEYVVERLGSLWNTVIENVRDWIMQQVVTRVTARLLSMLDPTGIMTVVNSVVSLYQAIQSFIRYVRQMLEVVNTFVEGVAALARGDVGPAADFLERALARAVPIAIGFLANQVGLSGLGRRIGEMIQSVRQMVDRALDWLMDRAVSAGTTFLNAVTGGGAPPPTAHDPEKQARIDAGLQAARNEERRLTEDGKMTHEHAEQVVTAVRRDHPVFTSFQVVDGGDSWNYRYTASPEEVMDSAVPKAEGGAGSSQPEWGAEAAGPYGSSVHVARLSRPVPPGGSVTQSGHSHGNFDKLRNRFDGARSFYVKGHLLNNHLGGPGTDWKNLTPMSATENTRLSSGFEEHVKNAVLTRGETVEFQVTATYGRTRHPQYQDFATGNARERKIAQVLDGETLVPVNVQATATAQSPASGSWQHTVPYDFFNSIEPDDYNVDGHRVTKVWLTDLNAGELRSSFGLTVPQSEAVVAAMEGAPPRSWSALESRYREANPRVSLDAITNIRDAADFDVKLFHR